MGLLPPPSWSGVELARAILLAGAVAERATWAVAEPPAEGRGRLRGVWRRYRIPQSPAESLQSLSPRGRAKRQTSLVDNWTISHFSKANPEDRGKATLRRCSEALLVLSMSSGTWRFRTSSSTANWKTGKIVPR